MTYTEEQINAAIERVEIAKQNHPVGWGCLAEFGVDPDVFAEYAFTNADAHARRLAGEDDRLIYTAAWLNGVMIGVALGEQTGDPINLRAARQRPAP